MLASIMRLLGLELTVPDHTTLSRRSANLTVTKALSAASGGRLPHHILRCPRNGSVHVPAGTSQRAQSLNAILNPSSGCANSPVEEGAGPEHRVHDHGEFPRHGNGCPLEADPLPQPEALSPLPYRLRSFETGTLA
jgi:hypothetical protein